MNATDTTASPTTPTPTGPELVAKAERLLAEAIAQLASAKTARAAREADLAVAEADSQKALQASRENRSSDKLAQAASIAAVRVTHARDDLADVVRDQAKVEGDISTAEKHLAEGRKELLRATLKSQIGALEDHTKPDVHALVASVLTVRALFITIRARLREDRTLIEQLHALRASELPPAKDDQEPLKRVEKHHALLALDPAGQDGTRAAGFLAGELVALGGAESSGNIQTLRWLFDLPLHDYLDPRGNEGAAKLCAYVLSSLEYGAASDASGSSRAELSRIAKIWPLCRDHVASDGAMGLLRRVEEENRTDANAREHHGRLTRAASVAFPARRSVAPRSSNEDLDDEPETPSPPGPRVPEGEFVVEGDGPEVRVS